MQKRKNVVDVLKFSFILCNFIILLCYYNKIEFGLMQMME
jgi:hypothetical protein